MNKQYLSEKHKALVAKRTKKVEEFSKTNDPKYFTEDQKKELKSLDRAIGRYAAVFNDKISAKAKAWLEDDA